MVAALTQAPSNGATRRRATRITSSEGLDLGPWASRRPALQMMSALNLIEIRPGLGCFVKTVSPEYIINSDVLAILLEKEAILEVIETCKIIESGIAALATERAKPEDFWRMEDVPFL